MELVNEMLFRILSDRADVVFPKVDYEKIIIEECYIALQKIKAVIQDDGREDHECFKRIESIVQIFERVGSSGGGRHDFG